MLFDLQGHRGARGLAPENTLEAFAVALSLGVTTLELDVGVTRDGVVVISHDTALNPDITRDATGRWLAARGLAIYQLTYDELRTYDVGRIKPDSEYVQRFPEQKPVDGTRIPKLSELFDLVRLAGNSEVLFNIETKLSPEKPQETLAPEPFTKALLQVIHEANMVSRVTIQSFDWRTLQIVQREAPQTATVYLTVQQIWQDNIQALNPQGSPWTAGFQYRDYGSVPRMVKAAGGTIWSPYFWEVNFLNVKEAHELGLKIVVWTVNEVEAIHAMLDLAIDGLISDRPDIVRSIMAQRGFVLPAAIVVNSIKETR